MSDKFIVEYTPVPTLKLRARFGFTHQSTQAEAFYSPLDTRFAETDFSERGSYGNTETQSNKYEGEFTLTYAKVLKEVHQFNIVLGGVPFCFRGEIARIFGYRFSGRRFHTSFFCQQLSGRRFPGL